MASASSRMQAGRRSGHLTTMKAAMEYKAFSRSEDRSHRHAQAWDENEK
jgi:hypothetical protein